MASFWQLYGEAAKTALGFFWKADGLLYWAMRAAR